MLALDIVEHIEDDRQALSEIARVLRPDGVAVITVPAFPFLWSGHDEALYHKRRYTRATLERALADAGLSVRVGGFGQATIFPAAACVRLGRRWLARGKRARPGSDVREGRSLVGRARLPGDRLGGAVHPQRLAAGRALAGLRGGSGARPGRDPSAGRRRRGPRGMNGWPGAPGAPTTIRLVAAALGLAAFLAVAFTIDDPGVTWDEPGYFDSARVEMSWLSQLPARALDGSLAAWASPDTLEAYWHFRPYSNPHPPFYKILAGSTWAAFQRPARRLPRLPPGFRRSLRRAGGGALSVGSLGRRVVDRGCGGRARAAPHAARLRRRPLGGHRHAPHGLLVPGRVVASGAPRTTAGRRTSWPSGRAGAWRSRPSSPASCCPSRSFFGLSSTRAAIWRPR